MKNVLKSLFLSLILACSSVGASDEYVGLSLSKPLGKEGFGLQLVLRRDNLELRGGADSNQRYQFGGGVTAGGNTTASAGFALSNYHGSLVPYVGAATEVYGDWEIGAVSYADLPYVTLGKRYGDDDEESSRSSHRSASDGSGGDSGDSGSGGSGDDDGGGDDAGGGDNGNGGDRRGNRSGQSDGTNPGNTEQDNGGTNNPGGGG